MKKPKKLLSIILTLCMILSLLPMTAQAAVAPVMIGTTGGYGTLSAALAAAADGDVIKLNENITESVDYTAASDKTVTIDGGGHTLTGVASVSCALTLSGAGTVILKDLTLQSGASSGTSTGLDVSGSVSVQCYGTVTANGSAPTASSSYGVTNSGTGTVDVTEAVAAGMQLGFGAYNTGSGTINIVSATGSGAINGVGAYNNAGGTINVTTATGSRDGVTNRGGGTINVTTAISNDAIFGSAITNINTGTVNAGAANGGIEGVQNINMGTINVGTVTGTTSTGSGTVNTGAAVTSVPLHAGTGTSCVLSSITIANSGSTIGTLPDVYKGSECSAKWYTGIALANQLTMQEISSEATLYSSFYTIETAEDVAAYIAEVSGLTAGASGSTVTVTGTATVTSTSDAALTFDIPADVTVVWKAALSGGGSKYLLEPTGDGTFEVADGADIVNNACQAAIYCYGGKGNLNVTGGKVSTTVGNGMAIGIAGGWLLTMTGGEVSANADNSCAIFGKNPVVITGGTISATGTGGYQLYMGDTSVYRSGVLNTGKIMYHTSVFAEVCVGAAVTQAVYGTSTGLTVTGHNLPTGDSVTALWAKLKGISGVEISYFSANDTTNAYETEFLAVPGITVTDTGSPTDSVPPAVTSVTPSGTGAAVNGNIAITFSEPMNTASGAVYLSADGGGSYGSVLTGGSWSVSDSVYTVPYSGLSYSKTYTIKIEEFKDADGNVMSMDTSYSFTTVAKPSTGGDTGGSTGGNSGGGGSSIPAAPTYNADVNAGNGSYSTLPVTIDKKSGSAGVDIGSGNGLMSGGKTTVITVPPVPDADTYTLGVPVPSLSTANVQGTLAFKTDNGSVTIPSNMLTGISGMSGSKAQISIGKGDKSSLTNDVKAIIGDRPLVQLTLSIDGKQSNWTNPNAAVTVSIPYTPTAEELKNPESIMIWYIDGSGKAVSVPNGHYDAATGTVTFDTTHFSEYAIGYNSVSFSDVVEGVWYNKAVGFIAARGITTGTGSGNFSPEAKLTRGEFTVMMMRAYGIAPDASPKDNFSDAGSTYYTGYLAAAKRLGISTGVGNNMFAPDKEITRQEMFTLLYNALKADGELPQGTAGKALSSFSDANKIDSWAKDAMTLFVKSGTISGSNGKLEPAKTTTRAEMAQVLYNLMGK